MHNQKGHLHHILHQNRVIRMLAWGDLQLVQHLRLPLEQLGRGQHPATQHAISTNSPLMCSTCHSALYTAQSAVCILMRQLQPAACHQYIKTCEICLEHKTVCASLLCREHIWPVAPCMLTCAQVGIKSSNPPVRVECWSAGVTFADVLRICATGQMVRLWMAQCAAEMSPAHSCARQASAVTPVEAVAGSMFHNPLCKMSRDSWSL